MALLKKIKGIDKTTFSLVMVSWNALVTYIPLHFHWSIETVTLIVTIGNAVILWLGVESNNEPGPTVQNPA